MTLEFHHRILSRIYDCMMEAENFVSLQEFVKSEFKGLDMKKGFSNRKTELTTQKNKRMSQHQKTTTNKNETIRSYCKLGDKCTKKKCVLDHGPIPAHLLPVVKERRKKNKNVNNTVTIGSTDDDNTSDKP